MKKLILSTTALLAAASLAACSGKQEVKTEASSSTEKTEKVTSKSSSSSKAEKTSSNTSSQTTGDVFPSDEELEKLKTVGDFKKCLAKIVDESNRLMTESMESLPESAKETFAQTADSDNAEVPKEFRENFIEQLKNARDSVKDSSESPVDQDSDDEDSDSDE